MPLPLLPPGVNLDQVVETALVSAGVIPKRESAVAALEAAGCDVETLATQLASLVYSARDATKLKAVQAAFSLHGIKLEADNAVQAPIFTFNVITEGTVSLNQVFAPERKF